MLDGEVLGEVQHPFATADLSSFLLQAKDSGADVIGLANAGSDTVNAIKQADPNFDETHRAYLYSKLNKLRDNNKLEKIKRGTWQRLD